MEAITEYQRENSKQWREKNAEYVSKKNRVNRKRRAADLRRWRENNREKAAEYEHRRRMAKRCNGQMIPYIRAEIFERDGWICQLCAEPVESDPTIDHIVPLSVGGEDSPENVQLAHRSCNSSKQAKVAAA